MRAAAGFDTDDAFRRQCLVPDEKRRVLFGVNIVGDDRKLVLVAQCPAQRQRQCSLPGADGAADANAQGMIGVQRSVFMTITCASRNVAAHRVPLCLLR